MNRIEQLRSQAFILAKGNRIKAYSVLHNLAAAENISLSEESVPAWWGKLSEARKKRYIERHPKSKFVKTMGSKDPETANLLKKVNDQLKAAAEKAKGAKPPEHNKPPPVPAGGHSKAYKEHQKIEEEVKEETKAKKELAKGYKKKRARIVADLSKDEEGTKAMEKMAKGDTSPETQSKAKKWMGMAAKLLLGAVAIGTMLTPLAGMAPEIASHFQTLYSNEPVAESSSEQTGKSFDPADFLDKFHAWLQEQDFHQLMKTLKENKE